MRPEDGRHARKNLWNEANIKEIAVQECRVRNCENGFGFSILGFDLETRMRRL